ncbi:hypothetical protein PP7435_CHR2-0258 [Komagataella phaffii CBS 7435]|uniref:Sorting nexin MVP1 n=2 Tax=Komagataella phaffii TaxID=460519 RepID=C4R2E6_KOMPG|nr:Hypothetical protein PAS_chr2-2_0244 [Komagataella phaffii GS115]AOA62763.1 GQ67_01088T0 [Komagataella phaffii]CAH2447777.1 hypothetical protein BQ9382_C2-1410 [Komagataella phaffii CBS 7435]AOA67878.1 GQ68_00301T0 [Komagataella phaffii GS115]CAY69670.1 Hypothetical protein PAS_chr2-2_0244 [Komagataella phaffii GS115]CCA37954.1 hypothetical protein PP7435_CHR2-0258 [Komagataella phaffii CBS 7435]
MTNTLLQNVPPVPIQLENDEESNNWCTKVSIPNYSAIQDSYVVFHILVTTRRGKLELFKRYSEFVKFRQSLLTEAPFKAKAIPKLPPKIMAKIPSKSQLEKRRRGLETFLNFVLLDSDLMGSSIKEFIGAKSER